MRRYLALVAVMLFAPLPLAQAPPAWTAADFDFHSWDGAVLKATIYEPTSGGPHPAIMMTHGWNGRHDSAGMVAEAERLVSQGYVVLTWTSRGFGESEGTVNLDGPNDVADVLGLIDLLAGHGGVVQDGPGDPRVGMVGVSYGGGIQLMTVQATDVVDAIVPITTWNNLVSSLAPGEVLKMGWIQLLYVSGNAWAAGPGEGTLDPLGGVDNALHVWYADTMARNRVGPEVGHELGVVRSVAPGTITTPALLVQGWPDTLFPPSEAIATFHDLDGRGVDVGLVLYPGGHGGFYMDASEPDQIAVNQEIDAWFDHHLKGGSATGMVAGTADKVMWYDYGSGYHSAASWPAPGVATETLYLGDGILDGIPRDMSRTLGAGGAPTTCNDVPQFQADAGFCPNKLPTPTWTHFDAAPRAATATLLGQPEVTLTVAAQRARDTTLFLSLEEVKPDGVESILRQTMPLRTDGMAATVTVTLEAVSHVVEAGNAVRLVVASDDFAFSASREAGATTVSGTLAAPASITLPWI